MYSHELADHYRTQSDEELLRLASDASQLTLEARPALTAELSIRNLTPPVHTSQEPQLEQTDPPVASPYWQTSGLLAETHRLYHQSFWFFAKLTAPAVLIGFLAIKVADLEIRQISRHLPHGSAFAAHVFEIFEMFVLRFTGFGTSFVAGCFSFAAICVAVSRLKQLTVLSARDCFERLRETASTLFCAGLVLYFGSLVTGAFALLIGLLAAFSAPPILRSDYFFMAVLVICAVPLARLGLAIPAIVLDGVGTRTALSRSVQLTKSSWFTLTVLVAESFIVGYCAAMLPFVAVSWLPAMPVIISQNSWLLSAASIAMVSLVESPMFIRFALLYLQRSAATTGKIAAHNTCS